MSKDKTDGIRALIANILDIKAIMKRSPAASA